MGDFKYIFVSLGNPLKEYFGTRHNIAADFTYNLLKEHGYELKYDRYIDSFVSIFQFNCGHILFILPQTYMNNSGKAVLSFLNKYPEYKDKIVIIHDELDVELGKIKISKNKSDAGHNGVKSIFKVLDRKDLYRIRIGISSMHSKYDKEKFVLGKFNMSEQEKVKNSFDLFQKLLYSFVCDGPDRAMNKFN